MIGKGVPVQRETGRGDRRTPFGSLMSDAGRTGFTPDGSLWGGSTN